MQQGAPSRGSGGCWGRGKTEMWSVNVVEVEIIFITITALHKLLLPRPRLGHK